MHSLQLRAAILGWFALIPNTFGMPIDEPANETTTFLGFEGASHYKGGDLATRAPNTAPWYCQPSTVDATSEFYYYDQSPDCQAQGWATNCCVLFMMENTQCSGKDLVYDDVTDLMSVIGTQVSAPHWYSTTNKGKWGAVFPLGKAKGDINPNVLSLWFGKIEPIRDGHLEGTGGLKGFYLNYYATGVSKTIYVSRDKC